MKRLCTLICSICCVITLGLTSANAQWTMSFSEDDFTVNNVFNIINDFDFTFVIQGDLIQGTYVNPPLVSVNYSVFGDLTPNGSPSGFSSFNLIRNIGGQEFYDQGSSITFEILETADLSDGLQGNEVDMTFILNCRELATGRYHPPLFELFGDGTGSMQNSNNLGGVNPGNGMEVDIDFGEEYIIELAYTPADLTLSTDIGVEGVVFDLPNGLPQTIDPSGGTTVRVEASAGGQTPAAGTGLLFYDTGSGFQSVAMNEISANVYDAVFPAFPCGTVVNYYFSADSTLGESSTAPSGAPTDFYSTVSVDSINGTFADDFETDQGWTVTGDVTDGQWDRGVPAGGGDRGDPAIDADGSGSCFLTDNVAGNSDVDDGTTILTSPVMDASGGVGATLSYYRWFSNNEGIDVDDTFEVEISNDNGVSWVSVETLGPNPVTGQWVQRTFPISNFVPPTAQMRIRFIVADTGLGSIVEAGVDGVQVDVTQCDTAETIPAATFNLLRGVLESGGVAEITKSDDAYLKYNPGFVLNTMEAPVWLEFDANLSSDAPVSLNVNTEVSADTPGLTQTTEMFDWNTLSYTEIDVQSSSFNNDEVITVDLTGQVGDFVQPGTGAVRVRTGWRRSGFTILFPWTVCIDQVFWSAGN